MTTVGDIRLYEAAFGQWIKMANNDISPEVIVRVLKSAMCQMNGTEDDALRRRSRRNLSSHNETAGSDQLTE